MGRHSKEQIREREALAQFGLKRCGKCRGVKPRVNYGKSKRYWDGLQSKCKDCEARYREDNREAINEQKRRHHHENKERLNEVARQYYQDNREARLEYQARYREENCEALKEYGRRWHEANREAILERKRQYYQDNKEVIDEKNRQWVEDNREAVMEYQRQYREQNREAINEGIRQWGQTPEGMACKREHSRKRRARKAAVNESFSAADERLVFERAGYKCESCGISNEDHLAQFGQRLHLDHILPLSKGHALTPDNCQVLCRSCNSKKGNR